MYAIITTTFLKYFRIYICIILINKHIPYASLLISMRSRRGIGDKPMSCKPGVAGSIPASPSMSDKT